MKYNQRSASVLSEADRFEQSLNVTLFNAEQNARMYGENKEVSWKPGIPMYKHPQARIDYSDFTDYGVDDATAEDPRSWAGGWGNTPRPMIQEMLDGDIWDFMDCKKCEVSWEGGGACWNCGKEIERGVHMWQAEPITWNSVLDFETIGYIESSELNEHGLRAEMRFSPEQFVEQVRLMQASFARMRENWEAVAHNAAENMQHFGDLFRNVQVQRGRRIRLQSIDEVLPFSLPNPEEANRNASFFGIELPSNWADLSPEVPLPELPELPNYENWRNRGRYFPPPTER